MCKRPEVLPRPDRRRTPVRPPQPARDPHARALAERYGLPPVLTASAVAVAVTLATAGPLDGPRLWDAAGVKPTSGRAGFLALSALGMATRLPTGGDNNLYLLTVPGMAALARGAGR